MNADKLTPDSFKERVASGQYESRTGALRALGRSDMSGADKDKCRKAVLSHFPEEESAKSSGPKKASKKVGKKSKTAPVKAPPPPGHKGKKKASKKATKKASARRASVPRTEVREGALSVVSQGTEETAEQHTQRLTGIVAAAKEGIAALDNARAMDPTVVVRSGIQTAAEAITQSMVGLTELARQLTRTPVAPISVPAPVSDAPVTGAEAA